MACLCLNQTAQAGATYYYKDVTDTNPKTSGLWIDYCKSFAKNCGKPAADEWCKIRHGSKSAGSISFSQKTLKSPERSCMVGKNCAQSANTCIATPAGGCGGFTKIVCRVKDGEVLLWSKPKKPGSSNYLDICNKWGQGAACQKDVATRFCQASNYTLDSFKVKGGLNTNFLDEPNYLVCQKCSGFEFIKCRKHY